MLNINVVEQVNLLISDIKRFNSIVEEERSVCGVPDYEYLDHEMDNVQFYLDDFARDCPNPTLGCLYDLYKLAKASHFSVKELEITLAHGQKQLELMAA